MGQEQQQQQPSRSCPSPKGFLPPSPPLALSFGFMEKKKMVTQVRAAAARLLLPSRSRCAWAGSALQGFACCNKTGDDSGGGCLRSHPSSPCLLHSRFPFPVLCSCSSGKTLWGFVYLFVLLGEGEEGGLQRYGGLATKLQPHEGLPPPPGFSCNLHEPPKGLNSPGFVDFSRWQPFLLNQ